MEIEEYFGLLEKNFERMNSIASEAKAKGYDPEPYVEIKAAPDLAARVEGIIGIEGIAELIKSRASKDKPRQILAFEIVKEICENERFKTDTERRLTLALRVGLSILTEGILVAPTEGLQGVELHKNFDGTDYISVLYAGPIRGAGGTSAALSVALADYGRKILGIGAYKATQSEAERWIEEMLLYHTRKARLQYLPSENDMRYILENCPVCVDGVPTEDMEIGTHRNVKRLDASGKEQMITNKIRGGIGLVVCEGIAQKAKSVLKYTKAVGLDWGWLNGVIKVDKGSQAAASEEKGTAVFLQELVAGRPVLAYPEYPGSFRLRYGRSRLTGIAAKGFSPATMYLLNEFIATGTQVKMERPGKGCIATPVDSIEGPFVKLRNGEAFRVNSIEQAKAVSGEVEKILSVGDILISYGDFKKSSTPLLPTSYVEEYWTGQLKAAGFDGNPPSSPSFQEAYKLSAAYNVPMHPRFIYDYADLSGDDLKELSAAIFAAKIDSSDDSIFNLAGIEISTARPGISAAIERLCIPHTEKNGAIYIRDQDAQSLLSSFGFTKGGRLHINAAVLSSYPDADSLKILNSVSPFKIMRRATRIGARIGRPEKAKERLMKPAPHILFPIGEHGGKERNLYKSYISDKRKFGNQVVELDAARYRCPKGKELVISPYCKGHQVRAHLERACRTCGRITDEQKCPVCKTKTDGHMLMKVNLTEVVESAMDNLGIMSLSKTMKGVKGLVSNDKIAEPMEKGILRSILGINIFKDGTSRFDATDAPITHFYPSEIGVSVEKLRETGYTKDYEGNELTRDDQLMELMHQDVIINRRGAESMLRIAKFMDELLVRFYKMKPFYNIDSVDGLLGQCVITLSPHTSCGVLGRIVGFTDANVGFAHPYTITARRRNCDGDEDTTMLALDALINFSRKYLPTTIGGTMDAPLILTVKVAPEEVDDEVHAMEIVGSYGAVFYDKTMNPGAPGDIDIELVADRLQKRSIYSGLLFTHGTGPDAVRSAPIKSMYTRLKSMQEKIDMQFSLMDRLYTIDRPDTAKKLILSHFIPDLMGNLHSFSKQTFRCVACNAKYRRVPLTGKCKRQGCTGRLVLTISKGGIEKYLNVAIDLANRYDLEPYIKQRILLLKEEIETVFGGVGGERAAGQFNLANYI